MAYTEIAYSSWSITGFNSKATPTTKNEYSCHVKAVALV